MRPGGFVQLSYWSASQSEWVDISNGILTINTKTGSDYFQGFWDQTDVGQFSISTRNAQIDPNVNPEIRFNTVVRLMTEPGSSNERSILYGFITDVNVEYVQNDFPRITLTGTDLIGFLNRIVITQDFIDTNITPVYPDALTPIDYLIFYISDFIDPAVAEVFLGIYASRYGFLLEQGAIFENSFGFVAPGTPLVKVEVGKTFYELIIAGCATGMIRIENLTGSLYRFLPYYKHDSAFYVKGNPWAPPEETGLAQFYFKSDPSDDWQNGFENGPEDLTYKFININDGFDRLVNQITVNNTNPSDLTSQSYPGSVDDASIAAWGPAKLDISTTFSPDSNSIWLENATIAEQVIEYNKDIFDYQSTPKMNIVSVTIDMTKQFNYDYYPYYPDNGSEFYIQHKVAPGQFVEGYYVVSGVRHTITDDSWFAEFVLRESEYAIYNAKKPKIPTIQLSATSGTTAQTFTASINNYSTAEFNDLEAIEWFVNLPGGWLPTAPPSQLFNLNKSFADEITSIVNPGVPTITTQTATWTYDDGGVLAGYPSPLHGPGQYSVAVWVRNKDGYTSCGFAGNGTVINVSGATAHADFIFTKDSSENVTFYNMSGGDSNTWTWNFGDGTTYSGANPPKKAYAASGTYNVTLTVFNGYTTSTVTKPVVINIYPLQVQYVRLRFQGTVTRPPGEFYYPVDLIESIGGVQCKNVMGAETGGIQPFYIHARNLDSVQLIMEAGHQTYQWVDYGIEGYEPVQAYAYTPFQTPYDPPEDNFHPEYIPIYIDTPGDFYGQNELNPMSQTMIENPNQIYYHGTVGLNKPKYKFHPVITDNPDGSQTKTYDFDLTFWYSQRYSKGTGSAYKRWWDQGPAGVWGEYYLSYNPGGFPTKNSFWEFWSGTSTYYNQRVKLNQVIVWPGDLELVLENGPYGPEGETSYYDPEVGTIFYVGLMDFYGIQEGHTYLPIEISVSEDGTTFRKIGEANYSGTGSTMTTTYTATMPALSNAPIQTP